MTRSVIVLSYQPGEWLADCLASVVSQADEVILIDNGSDQAIASAIGRAAGAVVVRGPTNVGFAGGVNLGLVRARGDIVALLNDDAVAEPGWLASAEPLLADPSVAAVTPRIRRAGWYREVLLAEPAGPLASVTVGGTEVLDRLLGAGIGPLEHDPADGRYRRSATPGRPFYLPLPDDGADATVLLDGQPAPPGAALPTAQQGRWLPPRRRGARRPRRRDAR